MTQPTPPTRDIIAHVPGCNCAPGGFLVDVRCMPAIEHAASTIAGRIFEAIVGHPPKRRGAR